MCCVKHSIKCGWVLLSAAVLLTLVGPALAVSEQMATAIQQAKSGFEPITAEEVAAARDELVAASQQFEKFLVTGAAARALFLERHADLRDPQFWADKQARLRAGVQEDVFPYPQEIRFRR